MLPASKKQKAAGYVDRTQILSGSRKMPNVLPGSIAQPCTRKRKHEFASKFKHRISVAEKPNVLDALVLENDICVLVMKTPISHVEHADTGTGSGARDGGVSVACVVNFPSSLRTGSNVISGRMKKGALNLKAGTIVCTVTNIDKVESNGITSDYSKSIDFVCPIGGKLLEFNDQLLKFPHLLGEDTHDSEGYIAIIYPDTEIPTLEGHVNYESLVASVEARRISSVDRGACFDFALQGACKRGSSCRFKHTPGMIPSGSVEATTAKPVSVPIEANTADAGNQIH